MSFEKRQIDELSKMIDNANVLPSLIPILHKMMNIIVTMQLDIDFFKEKWFSGKEPPTQSLSASEDKSKEDKT